MTDTTSHHRRESDAWIEDRKMVLQALEDNKRALEDYRTSRDAGLQAVNDLSRDFIRFTERMDARMLANEVHNKGLEERIEAWVKWGLGIVTLVVGLAIKAAWDFFTSGGAPHK